jgi:hypothetical protein
VGIIIFSLIPALYEFLPYPSQGVDLDRILRKMNISLIYAEACSDRSAILEMLQIFTENQENRTQARRA